MWIELPGQCMNEYIAQNIITDLIGEFLNIKIVANIHDLCHHALRHGNRLIWRFPPDIFAGAGP